MTLVYRPAGSLEDGQTHVENVNVVAYSANNIVGLTANESDMAEISMTRISGDVVSYSGSKAAGKKLLRGEKFQSLLSLSE